MPKKSFKWTHEGIDYTITKSNKSEKKLQAVYTNSETGRENVIHYGQAGAQHFYDQTGLLPKSLNHNDPERRKRYINRHRANEDWSKPSAGLLAKATLW
jgi:hypothetical protein